MFNNPVVFLFALLLAKGSYAQGPMFGVHSHQPTPRAFEYLLWPNSAISANDTVNEMILDLVEPFLVDSVIERKKQHHKVFLVGWLIHAFGNYNWRALSMEKQKFVGTTMRHSRSGEEQFTEYDINFDIKFHLKKYLYRVFEAYDRQAKIKRQDYRPSHRRRYDVPPFVRDTNDIDITQYRLHCELTPPRAFRPQLNYLFYATLPGAGGMKDHPNMKSEYPSMGFYGTYCLDCNHSCHPELHPYEWVWWLKATEDDTTRKKIWLAGMMHESSNRMKRWSLNPMTGSIAIPFAFRFTTDSAPLQVHIDHLVFNKFESEGFRSLQVPHQHIAPDSLQKEFTIQADDNMRVGGMLTFNNPVLTDALQFWFSRLNYDRELNLLSGYFHVATSVQDLYTFRVTFQ